MKEKLIGFLIIVLGAWPFLLKIKPLGTLFSSYKFLSYLTAGEIAYQGIIIVLGILLIWSLRPRVETRR